MEIINNIHKYIQSGRSWYQRNANAIKVITVHHSADWQDEDSDEKILQNIYNAHVKNGWPGLAYHFVYLPRSRKFYQMNKLEDITWHDSVNADSIGVLVHGYYHPGKNGEKAEVPTSETLADLKKLLDWLCTENPVFPADQDDVYGHRERSATACPGDTLHPYVVEYRAKKGNVNWGDQNPTDWRDYFKFDVTKKLSDSIFNGLNFHKAVGLPRETALDSIEDEWNKQNENLVKAIGKANENEGKYKTEVEEHKKTKVAFTKGIEDKNKEILRLTDVVIPPIEKERDDAKEALRLANAKIERLLKQEWTLEEAIDFVVQYFVRKYGTKKDNTTN